MRKLFLVFILILFTLCCETNPKENIDYREEMRDFVIDISTYAKSNISSFIIIPQNGIELITLNGEPDGDLHQSYLSAINGNGQEDLFYGYNFDNVLTPTNESEYLQDFLDIAKSEAKTILVTDYCSTSINISDSYLKNSNKGYVSFAADNRALNNIPTYPAPINNENNNDIISLSDVKNFLYLINPENYDTKTAFISSISNTNYDLLIMDLFSNDGTMFNSTEIDQLKIKSNGGQRLVLCYMSIGEAEDYRYYWESEWDSNIPYWLDDENSNWEGNYKVKYWDDSWKNIILNNNDSYIKKIIGSGFDGVYLDIIDAYEYFEEL